MYFVMHFCCSCWHFVLFLNCFFVVFVAVLLVYFVVTFFPERVTWGVVSMLCMFFSVLFFPLLWGVILFCFLFVRFLHSANQTRSSHVTS